MQKKVICLITNWYPTQNNPFQGIFFREQALALKDYFDFLVIHYKYNYSLIRNKSNVISCGEESNIKEFQITFTLPTLANYIKRKISPNSFDLKQQINTCFVNAFKKQISNPFDILYCISAQREAGYIKMIADAFHKPYVVSEHGPVPWLGTSVSKQDKEGIECADLLLAISYDKLRQIMMQDIKLPPFVYIGNMVDESQFVYRPSGNDTKTFIVTGAHVFYKNYEMLINIINKLTHLTQVPFKLMIVGYNANKGYSSDAASLEKAIAESEFAENVKMIPSVEHNKINELYNRADAFIMTSIQEGMPVSALEAGCCGLPIFSTRCGGVEDYVTEQIGRIYGILDEDSFALGLCEFLEGKIWFDPEYIRKNIIEKFGKKAFIQNMVHAFNNVIGD